MRLLLTLATALAFLTVRAQEAKTIPLQGAKEVVLTSDYPGLTIENGGSAEVGVNLGSSTKATEVTSRLENGVLHVDIHFDPGAMKPVKVTYEYEDGTVVTQTGDELNPWQNHNAPKATVKVPASVKLKIRATYGKVEIGERTGPMDIESTYGGITMKLPSGYTHDLAVTSGYSFVDLSVPKSQNYTVDLSSTYGEIMSNLDLAVRNEKGMKALRDTHIQANVGKGGPLLKVCATYQNIYLRGY